MFNFRKTSPGIICGSYARFPAATKSLRAAPAVLSPMADVSSSSSLAWKFNAIFNLDGKGFTRHNSRFLLKSRTNVSTHGGNLERRTSFFNSAFLPAAPVANGRPRCRKCQPSGPLQRKCMFNAVVSTPSSPPTPRSPAIRAIAAFTMKCVPIGWEPDHCASMRLSMLPTVSANDSDGRPM